MDKQLLYVYALHHNPGHDSSLYDRIIYSMSRMQSVDDKAVFVFVGDINAHHSEWFESVSLLIDMGMMLLIFSICQVVSCSCAVPLTLQVIDSIL